MLDKPSIELIQLQIQNTIQTIILIMMQVRNTKS